jgi:hypothetical protein
MCRPAAVFGSSVAIRMILTANSISLSSSWSDWDFSLFMGWD